MLPALRRAVGAFLPLRAAFFSVSSSDPTVSYLVSSCGLSHPAATRAARAVHIGDPASAAKADAFLALIRGHGFSESAIAAALRAHPALLLTDPAKTLLPNLRFLRSGGLPAALLPKILSSSGVLIAYGPLAPLFDALRAVLGSDARLVAAIVSFPFLLRVNPDNISHGAIPALRTHGLQRRDVERLMSSFPGIVWFRAERICEVVREVNAVGLSPEDRMFVPVLATFCKINAATRERKMAVFQSFGFSTADVLLLTRRYPGSMVVSEEKLRANLGFLMETVRLRAADIVMYPNLLSVSLQTLNNRCAVLSLLMREGKVEEGLRLPARLKITRKRFQKIFVSKHAGDIPDIARAWNGEIAFSGFQVSKKA